MCISHATWPHVTHLTTFGLLYLTLQAFHLLTQSSNDCCILRWHWVQGRMRTESCLCDIQHLRKPADLQIWSKSCHTIIMCVSHATWPYVTHPSLLLVLLGDSSDPAATMTSHPPLPLSPSDRGYVHCDLMGRNIMVQEDSSGSMHSKIADFGLSRCVCVC